MSATPKMTYEDALAAARAFDATPLKMLPTSAPAAPAGGVPPVPAGTVAPIGHEEAERAYSAAFANRQAVYNSPTATDAEKLAAHAAMERAHIAVDEARRILLSALNVENLKALPAAVVGEILDAAPGVLFLPNDHLSDVVAAERIFKHMGGTHELFRRGDAVVELNDENSLAAISPVMLQTRLNERGRKVRAFRVNDKTKELEHHAKRCGESTAKSLLATRQRNLLPHIKLVVRMPLLLEHNGALVLTRPGYNEFCGVYVTGKMAVPTVPIEQAGPALHGLLRDFRFTEPGDGDCSSYNRTSPHREQTG